MSISVDHDVNRSYSTNMHKTKSTMVADTSRGLGRYAARITVGQGPALDNAMRKAQQLYPELNRECFVDGWAAERNEMAGVGGLAWVE